MGLHFAQKLLGDAVAMCCAAAVAERKCSWVDEHFPRRTARVIQVTLQEIRYQVSA